MRITARKSEWVVLLAPFFMAAVIHQIAAYSGMQGTDLLTALIFIGTFYAGCIFLVNLGMRDELRAIREALEGDAAEPDKTDRPAIAS